jgi:hypothetical protein
VSRGSFDFMMMNRTSTLFANNLVNWALTILKWKTKVGYSAHKQLKGKVRPKTDHEGLDE